MCKISIVIPIFNRKNFVDELLNSILSQSFDDYEIVVVDNNSTDGTWELLNHHALTNKKIKLHRNTYNIGPVQNWKKGISLAQGYYTKILFSDDLLLSDSLNQLYSHMDDTIGFVACSPAIGKNTSSFRVRYKKSLTQNVSLVSSHNFIKHALLDYGGLVSPSAALFRTKDLLDCFVEDIDYPAGDSFSYYGAGPDLLLFLLIANHYSHIKWINSPLVFFRDHPSSATSSARLNKTFDIKLGYTLAKIWFARTNSLFLFYTILVIRNRLFLMSRGINLPVRGLKYIILYPIINSFYFVMSLIRNS